MLSPNVPVSISGEEERLLATQQLLPNEGEVMAAAHPRMLMLNVRPGCYSEPLLSEGLVVLGLHKTRGGTKPRKNLPAFPCEYRGCCRPDLSLSLFAIDGKREQTQSRGGVVTSVEATGTD